MTRKLLFLNGIAIIFAVYHHSIYWSVTAINYWGHLFVGGPTPELLSTPNIFSLFLRITDQIAGVAVPAFLFISGFFYSFSLNNQTIPQSYRIIQKRILYLLFPYMIWSTIMVVFHMIEGKSYTVLELIRVYLLGEADAPFYYVPLIVQLIFISPFLLKAIKNSPVVAISIAFLLQVLSSVPWYFKILKITPPPPLNFLDLFKNNYIFSNLFWFVIGMITFAYREKVIFFFKKYRLGWLILILFLIIFGQYEIQKLMTLSGKIWINSQPDILTKWLYLLLIMTFVFILEKVNPPPIIELIGTKSYGIYLSHIITIEICARLIYHLVPYLLGQTILFLGILVFVGIGIPLFVMRLSRLSLFKAAYSYLWG